MSMNKCIFLGEYEGTVRNVYGEEKIAELSCGRVYKKSDIVASPSDFYETEYIFSTWGMPHFGEEEIKSLLPSLKAVFYGAGSVQGFAREFLNCGVRVFSAWQANAIPVAEFTLSQILLASKGYFSTCREQSKGNVKTADSLKYKYSGNYSLAVGIIGAGMIGRKVIELLKPFSVDVYVFDVFLSSEQIDEMGATKVSLEELFEKCQVVSNHLANNKATVGMLDYDLFRRLQPYAAFINTGRGAQVVESDLVRILSEREDLTALLDVTYPEPPKEGHAFYSLNNCYLTPHIAGSMGNEVKRMGDYMYRAYTETLSGEKSSCEVTLEMLAAMA